MRAKISIPNFCLFFFSLIFLTGCNQSFDPIKESTSVPLSIYGYLDASADTQFVRITPIRYQLDQSLEVPEMHILLQRENSNETILFNDSLFQFRQGFNAINAWTTEDIQPDQTYQLRAERSDGAASEVSITIPKDFSKPQLLDSGDGCTALLRIKGVERIADIQSKWHVDIILYSGFEPSIDERFITFPLRQKARRVAEGEYEVSIDTQRELERIRDQLLVPSGVSIGIRPYSRNLFVASGGPAWRDEITSIGDLEYALQREYQMSKMDWDICSELSANLFLTFLPKTVPIIY